MMMYMIWYMIWYVMMMWYMIWYMIWYVMMMWYMIWYMIWYVMMIYDMVCYDDIWYDIWCMLWYMIYDMIYDVVCYDDIYDMIWYMIWYVMMIYDMIYDMVCYDDVWYGMLWWCIMIYVIYDMVCYDDVWYDIWYGMLWWCGMIWYDIWYDHLCFAFVTSMDIKRYLVIVMSTVEPPFKLSIVFTSLHKEVFYWFLEKVSFWTSYCYSRSTTVSFCKVPVWWCRTFRYDAVSVFELLSTLRRKVNTFFFFKDKAVSGEWLKTVWPSNVGTVHFFKTPGTTYLVPNFTFLQNAGHNISRTQRHGIISQKAWIPTNTAMKSLYFVLIGIWLSHYSFTYFCPWKFSL